MWDFWDTLIESVAGSGPARQLRLHQFKKEVERCGVAQAQRSRNQSFRTWALTPPSNWGHDMPPPAVPYTSQVTIGSEPTQRLPSFTSEVQQERTPVMFRRRTEPQFQRSKPYATTIRDIQSSALVTAAAPELANPTSASAKGKGKAKANSTPNNSVESARRGSSMESAPGFIDINRSGTSSIANCVCTQEKVDEEDLYGSSASNLVELAGHPLVAMADGRRKSSSSTATKTSSELSSPLPSLHAPPLWRPITQPSTTITPDGCVVQKGFIIGSVLTPVKSASSDSSMEADASKSTQHPATTPSFSGARARAFEKAKTERRFPDVHYTRDMYGRARQLRKPPVRAPPPPPVIPDAPPRKQVPIVRVVAPDEAENAIESDDDEEVDTDELVRRMKALKKPVQAPSKSILKKPVLNAAVPRPGVYCVPTVH